MHFLNVADMRYRWRTVLRPGHYDERHSEVEEFLRQMMREGYARVPCRRWTRAFRKIGVYVIHGPRTINRLGNWVPERFLNMFREGRKRDDLRGCSLEIQAMIVWREFTEGQFSGANY